MLFSDEKNCSFIGTQNNIRKCKSTLLNKSVSKGYVLQNLNILHSGKGTSTMETENKGQKGFKRVLGNSRGLDCGTQI